MLDSSTPYFQIVNLVDRKKEGFVNPSFVDEGSYALARAATIPVTDNKELQISVIISNDMINGNFPRDYDRMKERVSSFPHAVNVMDNCINQLKY